MCELSIIQNQIGVEIASKVTFFCDLFVFILFSFSAYKLGKQPRKIDLNQNILQFAVLYGVYNMGKKG